MCLPMLQPTHIHAHHHFNLMYCYLISHVCTFNFSAMRKKNLNHLYFFVCLFVFSFIFMILWCLFFFYYLFLIKRNRFSVFACLSLFYLYKTSKMDSSISAEEDIKNINNRLWKKTHHISILIFLLYHKFSQSVSQYAFNSNGRHKLFPIRVVNHIYFWEKKATFSCHTISWCCVQFLFASMIIFQLCHLHCLLLTLYHVYCSITDALRGGVYLTLPRTFI